MDRHLTDEELTSVEMAKVIYLVGNYLSEEVEKGDLKGCKLYRPCITDGPVVKTMNNILGEKADFMYYIQIESSGNFMKEAKSLKPFIEELDNTLIDTEEGHCFPNGRHLVAVNCVTTEHEDKFYHMVIFMMEDIETDCDTIN